MPWQVAYLSDRRSVEVRFEGELSRAELTDSIIASLAMAKAHGTLRFLCDAVGLVGGHTVFDLYGLAESLHALGLPPGAREAIILPALPERANDATFWENACINRGFEVRCFADRASALAWLADAEFNLTGT